MRLPEPFAAFFVLLVAGCGSGESVAGDPPPETGSPAQPAAPSGPSTSPDPGGTHPDDHGPYPIVLMHGMGGFEKLETGPVTVTYFSGIKADLAQQGETEVFTTVAPPYTTSEERSKVLAPQITDILKATHKNKVNLIGHSQGGLDARILASPQGLALGDHIASVTTVSTPHLGNALADMAFGPNKASPAVVDTILNGFATLLQKSVYDIQNDPQLVAQLTELSESYMVTVFNPKYLDDPRVAYGSYGGRANLDPGGDECATSKFPNDPGTLDATQPFLSPMGLILEGTSHTPNDGLVTVRSAKWGAFMQCVPADHLQEVGVLGQGVVTKFDQLVFFRTIVQRIRQAGN
jgi:triacylglycerol lipase